MHVLSLCVGVRRKRFFLPLVQKTTLLAVVEYGLFYFEKIAILFSSCCVYFFSLCSLQDTQDETAVLWLDEIQDGIHRANKDTEESERCRYCGIMLQLIPFIHADTGY